MTDQLKEHKVFWALKVLKKEYPHFYDPEVLIHSFGDAPGANPLAKAALNELFDFRRACPKSRNDEYSADPLFVAKIKECFDADMKFYETANKMGISRNALYKIRKSNQIVEQAFQASVKRRRRVICKDFWRRRRERNNRNTM